MWVLAMLPHGPGLPMIPPLFSVKKPGRQVIMPVGENVGLDPHLFSGRPPDGKAPVIHSGSNMLDQNPVYPALHILFPVFSFLKH